LLLLFRLLFRLKLNLKELFEYLVVELVLLMAHLEESLLLGHQREQGTFAQPLD
jgi:hypothetical protein